MRYSHVLVILMRYRYLAKQCYGSYALDMLGTGESGKPDGFTLTLADQAHATADFLQ
jgi:hypothetical protein